MPNLPMYGGSTSAVTREITSLYDRLPESARGDWANNTSHNFIKNPSKGNLKDMILDLKRYRKSIESGESPTGQSSGQPFGQNTILDPASGPVRSGQPFGINTIFESPTSGPVGQWY